MKKCLPLNSLQTVARLGSSAEGARDRITDHTSGINDGTSVQHVMAASEHVRSSVEHVISSFMFSSAYVVFSLAQIIMLSTDVVISLLKDPASAILIPVGSTVFRLKVSPIVRFSF